MEGNRIKQRRHQQRVIVRAREISPLSTFVKVTKSRSYEQEMLTCSGWPNWQGNQWRSNVSSAIIMACACKREREETLSLSPPKWSRLVLVRGNLWGGEHRLLAYACLKTRTEAEFAGKNDNIKSASSIWSRLHHAMTQLQIQDSPFSDGIIINIRWCRCWRSEKDKRSTPPISYILFH